MSSSHSRALRTRSLPNNFTSSSLPTTIDDTDFSPLIIMSGYLTKKCRGLGTRWLRRWWQLLGDGTLIYFKGTERLKVLGEIDIAHTCYEVTLGAQHCSKVDFPNIVPPNCCFSVSVLKRTYYFIAPSAVEAKKWSDVLTSVSYILNRSRSRLLDVSPAEQVAAERRETTPPTPPTETSIISVHRAPPPPPLPLNSSESTEDELPSSVPSYHSNTQHLSVPDLRYNSVALPIRDNDKPKQTPPTIAQRPSFNERHSSYGGVILRRDLKKNNQQNKSPHSQHYHHKSYNELRNNNEGTRGDTATLPHGAKLDKDWLMGGFMEENKSVFGRLEMLQKQEEEIRKRLKEHKQSSEEEMRNPLKRGVPVLPTDELSLPSFTEYMYDWKVKDNNNDQYTGRKSGGPHHRKKKMSQRKFPRAFKRKDTPHKGTYDDMSLSDDDDEDEDIGITFTSGNDGNVWVKNELTKLIEQIKAHGITDSNGYTSITFGRLQDKTDNLFDALLGTLLTARKHKIIDFDGDVLIKGVHDGQVIELLKDFI